MNFQYAYDMSKYDKMNFKSSTFEMSSIVDLFQDNLKSMSEMDNLKYLIHNLDLSYRLEWVGERKVLLTRHGLELGTFQL